MTKPGPQSRVLIVGGGIGGLTTAIALARNGMSATLLERSVFADETGAGIQLGPNATRLLAELGVLDAVEAVAFRPDLLRLFDGASGGTLASMPLGNVAEQRYGAPYLTFHRADLHAALLAVCRGLDAIDLRDGFDVTEVESLAGGITARGADGSLVEGSSLIAADGIWSRLRDRIAPHASYASPAPPPGVRCCRATRFPPPSMLRASGSGSGRAPISCITRCAAERM